jgi:cell division protein FtsL
MTITFETDNDVVIYAFEKVIAYTRRTEQVVIAICIWWLASVINFEQGLVANIDNIQTRQTVTVVPEKISDKKRSISPAPRDIQEDQRRDQLLKECEEFLK